MELDSKNLCMGCMRPTNPVQVCPECGYRQDPERSNQVLPYSAELNGKFIIGRLLGKPGGFGVTYLAWDSVLHMVTAIKEYLPRGLVSRSTDQTTVTLQDAQDSEQFDYGLEQFLQEARTLAQFSHPNVVRVRDFFRQNNTAYLVMDYYQGQSLDEYVQRRGGRLSEQQALKIFMPILDGLHEVHQKKILHRDIKPSNIYLTRNEVPILLDFGAARYALGWQSKTLSVILTSGYAPFEQYLSKARFGPWTDIYACGATMYAITTGEQPPGALDRSRQDMLKPPIELVPTLSPQFSRAIMAALAMEPEKRPQTVAEFQKLLQDCGVVSILADTIRDTPVSRKPPATVPQSTITVRCPHCNTPNTLLPNQSLDRQPCYRCGKKASQPKRSKAKGLGWKLPAVLVALIVVLIVRNKSEVPANKEQSVAQVSVQAAVAVPLPQNAPAPKPETQPLPSRAPEPIPSVSTSGREMVMPYQDTRIDSNGRQPPSNSDSNEVPRGQQQAYEGDGPPHQAPQFAVTACVGKQQNAPCTAYDRRGELQGYCMIVFRQLACIPNRDGLHPQLEQR